MGIDWNMDSKRVLRALKKDGWYHVGTVGDHWQFKHPTKPGKVTVQHPKKNYCRKTLKNIIKQAELTEF